MEKRKPQNHKGVALWLPRSGEKKKERGKDFYGRFKATKEEVRWHFIHQLFCFLVFRPL